MKKYVAFFFFFSIAAIGFIVIFFANDTPSQSISSDQQRAIFQFGADASTSKSDESQHVYNDHAGSAPTVNLQSHLNGSNKYGHAGKNRAQDVTSPWSFVNEFNTFDDGLSKAVQSAFDVSSNDFYVVEVNVEFLDALEVGDVFPVLRPGVAAIEEVYVRNVVMKNGITTITGNINGMDIGYGTTITYGYGAISGVIISQNDTLHIKTIKNKTVIMKGMRGVGDGGDDSPAMNKGR